MPISSSRRVNRLTPRHDQNAAPPSLITDSGRPWRATADSKHSKTASARSSSCREPSPPAPGSRSLVFSEEELNECIDTLVADPTDREAAIALELTVDRGAKPRAVAEAFLMAADEIDLDSVVQEVAAGEAGEVVGHSPLMMTGYHNQPQKTAEAEWHDADGKRFIRTGDVGRFDADGFLTLLDRKKDMIISGGFNIYPSDLEAVLCMHPDIAEVAVIGVASERWGETPVAFVVPKPGSAPRAEELLAWANARLGKTQRLADLQLVVELPRSAIGKVLKRALRDAYRPVGAASG